MGPITTDLQQNLGPGIAEAFFSLARISVAVALTPCKASLGEVAEGLAPEGIGGAHIGAANGAQHRRGSSPVPLRRPDTAQVLVARSVGVVSAASRVIGSISSDGSSADTYCHSTAYGCSTIDTSSIDGSAVDATAIDARATNAGAIREGVS
jgi:hypothetical protein